MRFKITHLLIATVLVAITVFATERATQQTAVVDFYTRTSRQTGKLYTLGFAIHYPNNIITGVASGDFGYNRLLDFDFQPSAKAELMEWRIKMRYRKQGSFWLPAKRIENQIKLHFKHVFVLSPAGHPLAPTDVPH